MGLSACRRIIMSTVRYSHRDAKRCAAREILRRQRGVYVGGRRDPEPFPRRCPATAKERATLAMLRAMGLFFQEGPHYGLHDELVRRTKRRGISYEECRATCGAWGHIDMGCWEDPTVPYPLPTKPKTPHK